MLWGKKGRFLTLLFLMIFSARTVEAAWQPELAVGLLSGQKQITVTVAREARIYGKDKKFIVLKAGEKLNLAVDGKNLKVNGKTLAGDTWELRPFDPRHLEKLVVTVNGREYRGGLKIIPRGNTMTVANILPTEIYLWGVVPEEMPADWPQEAVKAQAVAARTYALKNRGRHQSDGYDVCSSTHCQVYEGKAAEMPGSTKAVNATYGEVLLSQNKLIDAFFHTDSGGMTEHSENVWGTMLPYLRASAEADSHTMPWEKKISLPNFENKFSLGKLEKIELSPLSVGKGKDDRSVSGRVKSVKLKFSQGTKKISGSDMRSLFGLNSTLFDMTLGKNEVIFKGYGMGHGLGMSQWGAKAWAKNKTYKEILALYYNDTTIKKLY